MLSGLGVESYSNNRADTNSRMENGVFNGDYFDGPTVKIIAFC